MSALGPIAKRWLSHVEKRLSPKTFANYSTTIRLLFRFLPELEHRPITRLDIVDFLEHRRAKVGARTANQNLRGIRALLNWAWLNELGHPIIQLRRLTMPEGPREDWTLSPEQVDRVLAVAAQHDRETEVVVRIQAATGLRLREACSLVWSDVDFASGVLRVTEKATWSAKTTAAYRAFPAPALVSWLAEYRRTLRYGGPGDPICQRDTVRGIGWRPTSARINQRVRAVFDAAGVRERFKTSHRFRHTIASDMADSGVPIHVAQALLGHATPQVTQEVYTHARKSAVEAGALHLEEWRAARRSARD